MNLHSFLIKTSGRRRLFMQLTLFNSQYDLPRTHLLLSKPAVCEKPTLRGWRLLSCKGQALDAHGTPTAHPISLQCCLFQTQGHGKLASPAAQDATPQLAPASGKELQVRRKEKKNVPRSIWYRKHIFGKVSTHPSANRFPARKQARAPPSVVDSRSV